MKASTTILLAVVIAAPRVTVAQGAVPAPPDRSRIVSAAKDIMQVARFATFITVGDEGQPQARIVDPFAPDTDMTVWIATNPLTRKVAEIRRNPRVTLLYFNPAAQEFVTVQGTATLVTDPVEKENRWKPEWAALYKEGPRGDGYLLVRIRPSQVEVVSPRHGLVNEPKTWRPVIIRFP